MYTVFVKFEISNNIEQNIDETDSKQQISWEKKSANQKSRDFCQIFVLLG